MINIIHNLTNATCMTCGGKFTSSTIFATIILSKVFEELNIYREDCEEVNPGLLKDLIVYDIGYGKFDGHRRASEDICKSKIRNNKIPYSSCGLVFNEYKKILFKGQKNPKLAMNLFDKKFILGIDVYTSGICAQNEGYMNICKIIDTFNNPDFIWNTDDKFLQACSVAETIFDNIFESCCKMAEDIPYLKKCLHSSNDNILILPKYIDWHEIIFEVNADKVLFVIYPNWKGQYIFECVPTSLGCKTYRKPLPSKWLTNKNLLIYNSIGNPCLLKENLGICSSLEDAIEFANMAINAK